MIRLKLSVSALEGFAVDVVRVSIEVLILDIVLLTYLDVLVLLLVFVILPYVFLGLKGRVL